MGVAGSAIASFPPADSAALTTESGAFQISAVAYRNTFSTLMTFACCRKVTHPGHCLAGSFGTRYEGKSSIQWRPMCPMLWSRAPQCSVPHLRHSVLQLPELYTKLYWLNGVIASKMESNIETDVATVLECCSWEYICRRLFSKCQVSIPAPLGSTTSRTLRRAKVRGPVAVQVPLALLKISAEARFPPSIDALFVPPAASTVEPKHFSDLDLVECIIRG